MLRQYSNDPQEQYLRGFLGRMLFSGDEVYKPVKVLSGRREGAVYAVPDDAVRANVPPAGPAHQHLNLESIAALNNGLEAVEVQCAGFLP